MNIFSRRKFLNIITLFSFSFLIKKVKADGRPYRDRFQSYRQTFRVDPDPEEVKRIIKNIIKGRDLEAGLIELTAPDIAEDGNVVPIKFKVNCSMKQNDYPKKVHVLALKNPFPEVAIYKFTNTCGEAEVSFRCRMRTSSNIMIIAEMQDGRVGVKKKYVDVMLGACS